MKKNLLTIMATMLILGLSSCANGTSDDSGNPGNDDTTETTITSISTRGTETTCQNGIKFEQSDGSYYLFNEGSSLSSSRALQTTANGTWAFYNASGVKLYSGTFTGTISSGTKNIILTITKAIKDGKEGSVTTPTTFEFKLSGSDGSRTFEATIPEVTITTTTEPESSVDDENPNNENNLLPASVGYDIFKQKTIFSERVKDGYAITYKFGTDGTCTGTFENSKRKEVYKYEYSYNAETKKLYTIVKSAVFTKGDDTYSVSDYESFKNYYSKISENAAKNLYSLFFENVQVYEVSESNNIKIRAILSDKLCYAHSNLGGDSWFYGTTGNDKWLYWMPASYRVHGDILENLTGYDNDLTFSYNESEKTFTIDENNYGTYTYEPDVYVNYNYELELTSSKRGVLTIKFTQTNIESLQTNTEYKFYNKDYTREFTVQ